MRIERQDAETLTHGGRLRGDGEEIFMEGAREEPGRYLVRLEQRISSIVKERPSHKDILEFLKELITEQCKVKSSARTVPVKVDSESAKEMMYGFPLLGKKELFLDIASASKLFKRLCQVLSRSQKASLEGKRINQALRRKEVNFAEFFNAAVAEDRRYISALSKKLKVSEDLLLFLGKSSLRPLLETYANDLREAVDQERWWREYCPICGSPPYIARLREEGERFLACSLCSFEWRFPRLMCPFCGNKDPKGLRYFHTEKEGKASRVDVCEKCKGYIKTVDTRESQEEFMPLVEDMGTLHLDILALKEGYRRGVQKKEKGGVEN